MTTYKINEVARLAHVTVRTLHHYDELGLLVPSERTRAGYRLYRDQDLLRLQQILIHRELGFSLKAIKALLDAPEFEIREALVRQREQLRKKRREVSRMVAAVDAALARLEGQPTEMRDLFDGFDPEAFEDEAKARWGESGAFQESSRRMKGYGDNDLRALKAEQDDLFNRMAETKRQGYGPDSEEARSIAEAHRLYIDRWFYPCTRVAHAGLADMYVEDERFAQTFDAYESGLAEFFAGAIRANMTEG